MRSCRFRSSRARYILCQLPSSEAERCGHNARTGFYTVAHGISLEMGAVNFLWSRRGLGVLHDMPSYPWNHQIRHWSEPRSNKEYRQRQQPPHDLLGSPMHGLSPDAPSWRKIVRVSELPWLRDHLLQSNIVYPGAGFICLAIEAMAQISCMHADDISGYRLRDVDILQALMVPDNSEESKYRPSFGQ